MPNPKSATRPASGAPGVKLLITAASLVSTLGGWALISNNAATVSSTTTTTPTQPATARSIEFGPLPTLVPPPDPKTLILNAQPVTIQVSNQPVAAAAPVPAPPISGLRVVNRPPSTNGAPPPAAKTHSSKP